MESFSAGKFLEQVLLEYYNNKTCPCIKNLSLGNVLTILKHMGCPLDDNDTTFNVKLALRLKLLFKKVPPLVPINTNIFQEWVDKLKIVLRFQLKDIINQLKRSVLNDKDIKVRDYIQNDPGLKDRTIAAIERKIIELCSTLKVTLVQSTEVISNSFPSEASMSSESSTGSAPEPSSRVEEMAPIVLFQESVQNPGNYFKPLPACPRRQNTSSRGRPFHRTHQHPQTVSHNFDPEVVSNGSFTIMSENALADRHTNGSFNAPENIQPAVIVTEHITMQEQTTMQPSISFTVPVPSENPTMADSFQICRVESLAPSETPPALSVLQLPTTPVQLPTPPVEDDEDVEEIPMTPKESMPKNHLKILEMQTIMDKAKTIAGPIKSTSLDIFFANFVNKRGGMPTRQIHAHQLLKALNDCMTIHLGKRLELYTQVILEIFRFCLTNLKDFIQPDFDRCLRDTKYYDDLLYSFKALIKYVLTLSVGKLTNKLKSMQKLLDIDTIPLPESAINELEMVIYLPHSTRSVGLQLISQSNLIDFKKISLPKHGFTMKQIYNFPGVSVRCQLGNIVFGRVNIGKYKTFVSTATRKTVPQVYQRIVAEVETKEGNDFALTSKNLTEYFKLWISTLQTQNVPGILSLKETCTEFLRDVEYISPSRKAIAVNSEVHCSLSTFDYLVPGFINSNQVGFKHLIYPEVKVFLEESEVVDICELEVTCISCNLKADMFESEDMVKSVSKHLLDVHGYHPEPHKCVQCNSPVGFEQLLNERWWHTCHS